MLNHFFENLKFQQAPKEIYKDMLEFIIGKKSTDKNNKILVRRKWNLKLKFLICCFFHFIKKNGQFSSTSVISNSPDSYF